MTVDERGTDRYLCTRQVGLLSGGEANLIVYIYYEEKYYIIKPATDILKTSPGYGASQCQLRCHLVKSFIFRRWMYYPRAQSNCLGIVS